jgi:hypothetical protein
VGNADAHVATSFTVSDGALPAGLALGADGAFAGTPAAGGVFSFTVQARNGDRTATAALTATVEQAGALTLSYAVPTLQAGAASPRLAPALGNATPGLPTTYAVSAGALPAGLALGADGALTGTPTAAGTVELELTARNGTRSAVASVRAVVNTASAFAVRYPQSTYRLAVGERLQEFPVITNATPGTPTVFLVTGGGTPAELGLFVGNDGTLAGVPGWTGTFTLGITGYNGGRAASTTVTVEVESAGELAIFYPLPSLAVGRGVGTVRPQVLNATPELASTFALASGALPTGLSLGPDGAISGTPTAAGDYAFEVRVENGSRSGTTPLKGSVTAADGLALSYPAGPWLRAGLVSTDPNNPFPPTPIAPIAPTLAGAVAGATTFTLGEGTLPNGLALGSDGVISGSPANDPAQAIVAAGVFPLTVSVENGGRSATASLLLTVEQPAPLALAYPSRTFLSGQPAPTVFPAVANAVPGLPVTFRFTGGAFLAGLSFRAADGSVGGTVTAPAGASTTGTVEVANGRQVATAAVKLSVQGDHHAVQSHWLLNTGSRMGFPLDTSLDGLLAWNGNAGNFLTDIAIIPDTNNGNIPTVWVATYYDETGMGNLLDDPLQPGKQLGAVYYAGKRIGKGARSETWMPIVRSWQAIDAKRGLTATVQNFYGRFFNWNGFKLDPPPTGASAPYVALSDGRAIRAVEDPTAVDFDAAGRLWIADNGPDQNIKIFDLARSLTTPVETFGEKGGVFAGSVPGRTGPFRLWGPRGIAHDDAGHLYVGCTGLPMQTIGGTDLRMYSADHQTLLWQALGDFLHTADADPASLGTELYTAGKHVTMDYAQPPGKSWRWSGVTLDPFRYPRDARVVMQHESVFTRRIGGKLFYFMTDMVGSKVGIWRALESSEIAVPAGYLMLIDKALEVDPLSPFHDHPLWEDTESNKRVRWWWRDGSGDAKVDRTEFGTWENWTVYSQGIDVDEAGGIWYGGAGTLSQYYRGGGLQYWPCQGLDAHGVPIYDFGHPQRYDVPFAEFGGEVARLKYVAATDTLYLAGSGDHYYAYSVYRYDHFTDPARRTLASVTDLGFYDDLRGTNIHLDATSWPMVLPWTFTADQDFIYVTYIDHGKDSLIRGEVTIYDAHDGHQVDFITPGEELGGHVGTPDVVNGINVTTDAQGWKIITLEDDGAGKVIAYRWRP